MEKGGWRDNLEALILLYVIDIFSDNRPLAIIQIKSRSSGVILDLYLPMTSHHGDQLRSNSTKYTFVVILYKTSSFFWNNKTQNTYN